MMKTNFYHRLVLKHPVDFLLGDLLIQTAMTIFSCIKYLGMCIADCQDEFSA